MRDGGEQHLDTAETSPFIASMLQNSLKHISEIRGGKQPAETTRDIIRMHKGPGLKVARPWPLHTATRN